MRILLDECIDWRLGKHLSGHTVSSVFELGWSGTKNGELLGKAELQFDCFITVDQSLISQQDLRRFRLIVVILSVRHNRLDELIALIPALLEGLATAEPGLVLRLP